MIAWDSRLSQTPGCSFYWYKSPFAVKGAVLIFIKTVCCIFLLFLSEQIPLFFLLWWSRLLFRHRYCFSSNTVLYSFRWSWFWGIISEPWCLTNSLLFSHSVFHNACYFISISYRVSTTVCLFVPINTFHLNVHFWESWGNLFDMSK